MTRMDIAVAIGALLAGCTANHYLGEEDAGPGDASASSPDAGPRPDAGRYDAGWIWPDARAPWDAGPVWGSLGCHDGLDDDARNGDDCTGSFACGADTSFALCDITGRLLVVDLARRSCSEPAPSPWDDCDAAVLDGFDGQACSGMWYCAARSTDQPCCVEVAACNYTRIGGGGGVLGPDRLTRTRVCMREDVCPATPQPDRPTRDACPSDVWELGDPEILDGDACTGSWACMLDNETAFLTRPGHAAALLEAVPVWCDGATVHVAPAGSPQDSPRSCR